MQMHFARRLGVRTYSNEWMNEWSPLTHSHSTERRATPRGLSAVDASEPWISGGLCPEFLLAPQPLRCRLVSGRSVQVILMTLLLLLLRMTMMMKVTDVSVRELCSVWLSNHPASLTTLHVRYTTLCCPVTVTVPLPVRSRHASNADEPWPPVHE